MNKIKTVVFEFNLELFRIYNHTIIWAERCSQHADITPPLNGEELIVLDMIRIEENATMYQINITIDSNHNVNKLYY